ncbi:MAG TPA: hypothetical protein VFE47_22905 [Tepidisphaeraceae bacterium]|nr:hypothetical protein [Tepidisphaeraceae bacterium]
MIVIGVASVVSITRDPTARSMMGIILCLTWFVLLGGMLIIAFRLIRPEILNLMRLRRERRDRAHRGFAVVGPGVDVWSDPAKVARLKQLGDMMSAISVRCCRSGWLTGAEYLIPELCRRAIASGLPQPWGDDELTLSEAEAITQLSMDSGAWANLDLDSDEYVPIDPFPIPREYLEEIPHDVSI